MASLTLKKLPDDLLDALRQAARRDRRSVTQEIVYLLEVAVRQGEHRQPPPVRAADVQAQVEAWRRLAGRWESDVDEATETERIMAGRTRGREVDL